MGKEYFFATDQLVVWRPTGLMNTKKILEFITFLNSSSKQRHPHFSRFIDLTQISGISVNYKDLYPIAEQRKAYYSVHIKQTIKMAFLVNNPISYGMARMYQMLTSNPQLDVNIFKELEEVSNFLKVDISLISP